MAKIILKVRDRKKRGYDISSVPMKKLEKINKYKKKRWNYENGLLILEAW